MAFPTILFNNASGSDTAASGAGPATALTGTSASYSGTTVTLDGSPDLSGVATDGSHVLYLVTSTGRKFFTINAKDDGTDTVTLDDAPAGTASGLTWAIGGKRKTLDNTNSRLLFSADIKAGWIAEIEDAQTLTSALAPNIAGTAANPITLRGAGSTPITITQSANATCIAVGSTGNYWMFKNLKIQNSNGTKTSANGLTQTGNQNQFIDGCIIGDATNTLQNGIQRALNAPKFYITNTIIMDCAGAGVDTSVSSGALVNMYGSAIVDCGGHGISVHPSSGGHVCGNSIVARCGGDGLSSGSWSSIRNNNFDAMTSDGINIADAGTGSVIVNNNFTNNGAYGVVFGGTEGNILINDFNNYYNNTSGARSGLSAGANDLTVDPQYTDAANNDWSIGTNLKAKGYPGAGTTAIGAGQTSTISYVDIGAAQRQEAGGGLLRHPGMQGGLT